MCLSSSESSSKLLRLLDAVTDALVSAIGKTVLTFRQQYTRLAHLLMLLSHIRHVRYKNTSCHANILILCSIILTQSRFIIPFFFKVTKAWTTSTAWKWRTWCLCMTCCWRCWTPTSCTAPVCLDGAPSRSPRTRVTLLLRLTAPVAAPHTPGLPAALKAQVNRSSQLRIFEFFCPPLCAKNSSLLMMRLFTGTFCRALTPVDCENEALTHRALILLYRVDFKDVSCVDQSRCIHCLTTTYLKHKEEKHEDIAVRIWPVAPALA